jgi:tetratricopeptide (TPR) repeat protein
LRIAERRHRDPEEVLAAAESALDEQPQLEVDVTARWVRGLALHELGRLDAAIDALRSAAEASAVEGIRVSESRSRAALAVSLLSAGRASEAAEQIGLARRRVVPESHGYVEMMAALIEQRRGRLREAQTTYGRALRLLQQSGDRHTIARLLLNRGTLRAYRGDWKGAIGDLERAEVLAVELDMPVLAAMAAHNLGFAHGRRSDVPRALTAFSRAEAAYAGAANPRALTAVLQADLCEVLLDAGLLPEAERAAERAVAQLADGADTAYLSECRLLHARVLLAAARYQSAAIEATAAGTEFRRAGRMPWAALADYVGIQAEVLAHQDQRAPSLPLLERCQEVARELDQQGWRVEAGHVRTFVARIALSLGLPEVARRELAEEEVAFRHGTLDQRLQARLVRSLVLMAEGERAAARRSLSDGLRLVESHLAALGSSEVRAHAAGRGADLARLGLGLAISDGRPMSVLRWAERWRAMTLWMPPPNRRDDDVIAALADLRRLRSEIKLQILDGGPTRDLEREAVRREEWLRRRMLQTPGSRATTAGAGRVNLRDAFRERCLVEFTTIDDRVLAITLNGSRARLADLGSVQEVEDEGRYLAFAIRRATRLGRPADQHLVDQCASRLADLLIAPLDLRGDKPVVLVPTGSMYGLAWGQLPGLAGRDFTLAPSAALWARTGGRTEDGGMRRAALVAGPDLPGAEEEIRQIHPYYPGATVLVGGEANSESVIKAIGACDIAHVAAHGQFRADSPLFSSFSLGDGPLTVHDLERAERAPTVVVLASCHAALSGVGAGDDLIGTAATLLAMGLETLIAPVEAVPDLATTAFMVELHKRLCAGEAPSAALAALRLGGHAPVAKNFVPIGRRRGPFQQ